MPTFFDKLKPHRSVLQRSSKRADLPKLLFYLDWHQDTRQRTLLDPSGAQHRLADAVLESNYRLTGGSQAEALIEEHWASHKLAPAAPAKAKVG